MDKPKIFALILALLSAILLWIYVSSNENPIKEKTITVPLEIQNLNENYVVDGIPSQVTIRCQVSQENLPLLALEEIEAYVDLKDINTGENTLKVRINSLSEVKIINISPFEVDFTANLLQVKEVPLSLNFEGEVALGYVLGNYQMNPSVVEIKGAKEDLDKLDKLELLLNLNKESSDIKKTLEVNTPEGIRLESNKIYVEVEILKMPSKIVNIEPKILGEVANGYEVKEIALSPDIVEIFGEETNLNEINSISTSDIDISNKNETITQNVKLIYPSSIKLLDPEEVEVRVAIEAIDDYSYIIPEINEEENPEDSIKVEENQDGLENNQTDTRN